MIRIIGGTFKGRRLKTFKPRKIPKGSIRGEGMSRRRRGSPKAAVRFTADRVKEALFDILGQRIVDSSFLDLYAGSGSIGIEALSRGARRVTFCEKDPGGIDIIKHNLVKLKCQQRCEVYRGDAIELSERIKGHFDIAFLDPPYRNGKVIGKILQIISRSGILKEAGLVIAEHHKSTNLAKGIGRFALTRQARYGDTVLSFYGQRTANVGFDKVL